MEPECRQVCKFVKNFCPQLFGVCAAGVEVPCELVEIAAHPAALVKQGGNGSQGFFSTADNDNSALDLRIVQRAADESGQGEMRFASPRLRSNESPRGAFKRQNGLASARWRGLAPTSSQKRKYRPRSTGEEFCRSETAAK